MEAPDDVPAVALTTSVELRRPFGVALLSVLTGIIGLVALAAFVIMVLNWQENNEYALRRRMAPSMFWCISGSGVVMAFAATIGMWRGAKWGWWLACCGLVLSVIQHFGQAATVNPSQGTPSFSTFLSLGSQKFVVRGIISVMALSYWLSVPVRRYFHVERTSKIKAVALAAAYGIGITVIVTVVLQSLFLYRTR